MDFAPDVAAPNPTRRGRSPPRKLTFSRFVICQDKPKPPQIVLRDFGDQEVIMEVRYYVPNAPLMRSTKSYYVKEILKQFEEQDVKLAYPTRLIMKEDIE